MTAPVPDNAAAVAFLKLVYPDGPWLLTAIRPDRKAIDTKTFRPSSEQALLAWLQLYNGDRNIYWSVNPPIKDLTKKAEREDIKEVAFLHVDIDPRVGEDLEAERVRCVGQFGEERPASLPLPTAVIFSGGGYQGFWRLQDPIAINGDLALAEDAGLYSLKIEQLLEGDNCHNIDRIMRLPGTINVPDERKKKKGRLPELAVLVSYKPENVYPISMFTKAPVTKAAAPTSSGPKAAAPAVDTSNLVRIADLQTEIGDVYGVPARVLEICAQGRAQGEVKAPDDSRSMWVFDCVCNLLRANVPTEKIFSILTDPEWQISASILEKGSGAERYALRQIERGEVEIADPVVSAMNQCHAAVSLEGKFRVMTLKPDRMYPTQMVAEFSSRADFCHLHDHPRVAVSPKKSVSKGQYFLDSPMREQFDGIDFDPGEPPVIERKGFRYANMYTGFAVKSVAGDCGLYLDHVRDNICDGNVKLYEYVLDLMASGVQHPADPQRVALSMRGVPGCGKGVFATEYGKLFGRHFLHITNPSHLTGKFNAHSSEALFELADETLNLDDPVVEAQMKTHISERTRMIERKGVDAFQAKSFARVWFMTNDEHPLMIEDNDRRYCALYVSSARAKDKAYFLTILNQMRNGGREALLHFLLGRDISKFNAEDIPQTKELQLQKQLSASAGDQVIIGFAQEGHLPGALVNLGDGSNKKDRPWIARSRGADGLFEEMRRRGGRKLQHVSEQSLTSVLKSWGFTSKHLGTGMGWEALPLDQLRAKIAAKFPGIEWDNPELSSWGGVTANVAKRQRRAERDEQQREDQQDIPF